MAQSFVDAGDVYLDRLTDAGVGQGFVRMALIRRRMDCLPQ